jgi:hypothetical protein
VFSVLRLSFSRELTSVKQLVCVFTLHTTRILQAHDVEHVMECLLINAYSIRAEYDSSIAVQPDQRLGL